MFHLLPLDIFFIKFYQLVLLTKLNGRMVVRVDLRHDSNPLYHHPYIFLLINSELNIAPLSEFSFNKLSIQLLSCGILEVHLSLLQGWNKRWVYLSFWTMTSTLCALAVISSADFFTTYKLANSCWRCTYILCFVIYILHDLSNLGQLCMFYLRIDVNFQVKNMGI